MLRLKEKPSEWIKFTGVMALSINLPVWLLWWSGLLHLAFALVTLSAGFFVLGLAGFKPPWFRGFYRVGMTISYHIGQCFGKALLILFFIFLLTPLGLLLRLMGKDLLRLKKDDNPSTHWHTAKNNREFDRMF